MNVVWLGSARSSEQPGSTEIRREIHCPCLTEPMQYNADISRTHCMLIVFLHLKPFSSHWQQMCRAVFVTFTQLIALTYQYVEGQFVKAVEIGETLTGSLLGRFISPQHSYKTIDNLIFIMKLYHIMHFCACQTCMFRYSPFKKYQNPL